MPERSSSIRMSRRSSLAGFRRSVTENPETSELLPTQWEGGLDAICILVGPKMSDPPLEGGVVWIQITTVECLILIQVKLQYDSSYSWHTTRDLLQPKVLLFSGEFH